MTLSLTSIREDPDVAGQWGSFEYTGWQDENLSWKEGVYIGDWSWLEEVRISGPDALRFFSELAVNDMSRFAVDQAKHAIFCSAAGKVIGEGVLMRQSETDFVFNARSPINSWLEYSWNRGDYSGTFAITLRDHKLQVSGPRSLELLESLIGEQVRRIPFMHVGHATVAGHNVQLLRQGMAGEVGFEMQGDAEFTAEIRDAVLAAGEPLGIRRLGARSAMINHLEAGFPTVTVDYLAAVTGDAERDFLEQYGQPVADVRSPEWARSIVRCLKVKGSFEGAEVSDWFRSPVELGWARNIHLDHDFYGREAVARELAAPIRAIVSLVWNLDDVAEVVGSVLAADHPYDFMDLPRAQWFAMYANSVRVGEREIGVATSRGYSYFFRSMLSHAVLETEFTAPGTQVEVVWGDPGHPQKRIRATVHRYPFKDDKRKVDLGSYSAPGMNAPS
ncbi:MAG TPA: hypothetical protein VNT53_06630 [Pseudolysinimonas sp.]|nr:hypothetical protein [Pseudolysinimonas sp.]